MHALVLLCINPRTTFEGLTLTISKIWLGPNFFNGSRDSDHTNYGVFCYPKANTWYHTFYLHTKFGNSRFSHSGYMITGIKTENGLCDHDHAPLRSDLSHET